MNMENLSLIEKFCRDKQAEGISKRRLTKYKYTLIPLSKRLNKSFEEANEEDLKTLLINLKNSKQYKEATIKDFKIILRLFYRYLYPQEDEKAYPKIVRWIKIRDKNSNNKLPEELLTQEDIKKLIEVGNVQDQALVGLLYESGMR